MAFIFKLNFYYTTHVTVGCCTINAAHIYVTTYTTTTIQNRNYSVYDFRNEFVKKKKIKMENLPSGYDYVVWQAGRQLGR